jgi:hypothetical protein
MTTAEAQNLVAASNKRKVSDEVQSSATVASEPPKKKSPLFNRPQNFYVPPTPVPMTKELLSEWRKEQRRERNRESAAASRNKIRSRIEELEGEVDEWKTRYQEIETKMKCMERHIKLLTSMCGPHAESLQVSRHFNSVSQANSPPSTPLMLEVCPSPVDSSTTFHIPPLLDCTSLTADTRDLFPPLLSKPQDCTQVEEMEPAILPTTASNIIQFSHEEKSKEHLTPISRHA